MHELGHPVVARRRGVKIEATDLWLLGGVAQMSGQPNTAETSCASRSPAPAVTAVVAGVFGALELAGRAGLNAQQRTRARHTTIADAIPAEADEVGANAIILGTRGLTGIKSLLWGSVSHAVLPTGR